MRGPPYGKKYAIICIHVATLFLLKYGNDDKSEEPEDTADVESLCVRGQICKKIFTCLFEILQQG